jgi:hypothetical protein
MPLDPSIRGSSEIVNAVRQVMVNSLFAFAANRLVLRKPPANPTDLDLSDLVGQIGEASRHDDFALDAVEIPVLASVLRAYMIDNPWDLLQIIGPGDPLPRLSDWDFEESIESVAVADSSTFFYDDQGLRIKDWSQVGRLADPRVFNAVSRLLARNFSDGGRQSLGDARFAGGGAKDHHRLIATNLRWGVSIELGIQLDMRSPVTRIQEIDPFTRVLKVDDALITLLLSTERSTQHLGGTALILEVEAEGQQTGKVVDLKISIPGSTAFPIVGTSAIDNPGRVISYAYPNSEEKSSFQISEPNREFHYRMQTEEGGFECLIHPIEIRKEWEEFRESFRSWKVDSDSITLEFRIDFGKRIAVCIAVSDLEIPRRYPTAYLVSQSQPMAAFLPAVSVKQTQRRSYAPFFWLGDGGMLDFSNIEDLVQAKIKDLKIVGDFDPALIDFFRTSIFRADAFTIYAYVDKGKASFYEDRLSKWSSVADVKIIGVDSSDPNSIFESQPRFSKLNEVVVFSRFNLDAVLASYFLCVVSNFIPFVISGGKDIEKFVRIYSPKKIRCVAIGEEIIGALNTSGYSGFTEFKNPFDLLCRVGVENASGGQQEGLKQFVLGIAKPDELWCLFEALFYAGVYGAAPFYSILDRESQFFLAEHTALATAAALAGDLEAYDRCQSEMADTVLGLIGDLFGSQGPMLSVTVVTSIGEVRWGFGTNAEDVGGIWEDQHVFSLVTGRDSIECANRVARGLLSADRLISRQVKVAMISHPGRSPGAVPLEVSWMSAYGEELNRRDDFVVRIPPERIQGIDLLGFDLQQDVFECVVITGHGNRTGRVEMGEEERDFTLDRLTSCAYPIARGPAAPSVLFLNACEAGRLTRVLGELDGFVLRFPKALNAIAADREIWTSADRDLSQLLMRCSGEGSNIGNLVASSPSCLFLHVFLEEFHIKGCTIGRAFRLAKEALRSSPNPKAKSQARGYVLYGLPCTRQLRVH